MVEDATHRLPEAGRIASPDGIRTVRGARDGSGMRIGIVCSEYNAGITERLLTGAVAEAGRCGIAPSDITVVVVPGAFELALAALALTMGDVPPDAIVCLGSVIHGETSHYDLVAGEAAAGCTRVQLDTGVPVAFGVLTTENLAQAVARSGGEQGDKGAEAVTTAIEMAEIRRELAEIPAGVTPVLRAR